MKVKVLLTGCTGQLGQALQRKIPEEVDLISFSRTDLDLADNHACKKAIYEIRPHWVINAAAYTAVDKAESDISLAYAINEGAPNAFALALADIGGRLLQISTDFVFSGSQGVPYKVHQPVEPLGVYAASKAAGENAALKCPGSCVVRTSWLYSHIGHNFCLTMLRLHAAKAAKEEVLSVVADQVGCPTSTFTLAEACWRLICLNKIAINRSVFHWSDAGVASWYDFAVAIGELGTSHGLLEKSALVKPISTDEYPTPAHRPSYSLLDCSETTNILKLEQQHWRLSLSEVFKQIRVDLALDKAI